jgi:NB-ARC domain
MLALKSLSEQQMFVLLRAFEQDCREIIDYFIEGRVENEDIYSGLTEKINQRKKNEKVELESDLELLDLSDLLEIIFRYKNLLPNDILLDFTSLKPSQTNLIRIRNRVMHARPLSEDDDINLLMIVQDLSSTSWKNIKTSISMLSKGLMSEIDNFEISDESPILHNLPRAEHGETGLVGRSEDIKQITNWLLDDRTSVITIAGSGGLGKTALAIQVAYDLLDNKANPFDAILWVSLKQERLTPEGIRSISNAISDIPSAIIELGSALDSNFKGAVENLREAISGSKVLICLDNLETISGTEFIELYEALPDVKFLLTSRLGIGQIERRYELAPLNAKDSLHYLHLLIRKYRVSSLESVSEDAKKQIVSSYVHNPLSIKWFVLSIGAGKTIYDIKNNNKDLLTFCVESVVIGLTKHARAVMLALFVAKGPVFFEELIGLTGLTIQEISNGIQELNRSALIRTRVLSSDYLRQEVELSEIAVEYLKISGQFLRHEIEQFEQLNQKQLLDEENRQKDLNVSRFTPYSITVDKDEQKSVAAMLREAVRTQKLNPKQALELVETAKLVAPDYWQVYKVEAYIRHFLGEDKLVEELYQTALNFVTKKEDRAVVKYLIAKHYLDLHELNKARESAAEGLSLFQSSEGLHQLGWIEVRCDNFESGINHITSAVQLSNSSSRLVFVTSLISAYRRWSEHILATERNCTLAHSKLKFSRDLLTKEVESGVRDLKFFEENAKILYQASEILKVFHRFNGEISEHFLEEFKPYYSNLEEALRNPKMGKKISDQVAFLSKLSDQFEKFFNSLHILELGIAAIPKSSNQSFLVGTVHSTVDGRYGFIEHPDYPQNIFFSGSALLPGIHVLNLSKGQSVTFELDDSMSQDSTRVRARSVWPSDLDS